MDERRRKTTPRQSTKKTLGTGIQHNTSNLNISTRIGFIIYEKNGRTKIILALHNQMIYKNEEQDFRQEFRQSGYVATMDTITWEANLQVWTEFNAVKDSTAPLFLFEKIFDDRIGEWREIFKDQTSFKMLVRSRLFLSAPPGSTASVVGGFDEGAGVNRCETVDLAAY